MGQGGTPHTLQDQEGSWPEPLLYVLKQIPSFRRASAQALADLLDPPFQNKGLLFFTFGSLFLNVLLHGVGWGSCAWRQLGRSHFLKKAS